MSTPTLLLGLAGLLLDAARESAASALFNAAELLDEKALDRCIGRRRLLQRVAIELRAAHVEAAARAASLMPDLPRVTLPGFGRTVWGKA